MRSSSPTTSTSRYVTHRFYNRPYNCVNYRLYNRLHVRLYNRLFRTTFTSSSGDTLYRTGPPPGVNIVLMYKGIVFTHPAVARPIIRIPENKKSPTLLGDFTPTYP